MTTRDIDPQWFEPDNFDPCEGCASAMLQLVEVVQALADRFKAHEAECRSDSVPAVLSPGWVKFDRPISEEAQRLAERMNRAKP